MIDHHNTGSEGIFQDADEFLIIQNAFERYSFVKTIEIRTL